VNPRRLYRCRHDRQLAGVAGGMAEYFDVDPTLVRVLWIVSVFFGGISILLYLILAVVMPIEPVGMVAAAGGALAPDGSVASDGSPTADPDAATGAWAVPAAHAWPTADAGHQHRSGGGDGRFGLALGALLVAFGSIALVGPLLPGWVTGIALGPAFVIALGVALVVFAVRRPTTES
jgi:phage shock protein C